ncbi:murein biosynthesis integral membrane protein MurJ [Labrys wisconsinensis]|uniref:Probable lipid II flippase MurJ n=1 Tax=Labrys wisconsinensis TaxID=425677 RepID=A0ABU0J610_9HYPH|nr:murein biosynthesis integral membrane protein MurJ [Labrys wisconsinensis]MDQ0469701.1 putative peptidoglycan lipid II flippase [Labrys wisconsinensis]
MLKKILSVGAWTLVSRVTGFARDVFTAAILGTGPMADAFVVAFRLPNNFRAIFGEGAFSNSFVPAYTRIEEQAGRSAAAEFQGRIASLLLVSTLAVTLAAILFMPQVVSVLAPGFGNEAGQFDLAVTLTRITFPYLPLITLATLYGAVLNAAGRFTAFAAAPILLNLVWIAALLAAPLFPSPAHAVAWGVTISGAAQLGVVWWAARRARLLARLRAIRLDPELRRFFRSLGPALIGSMGVQIAMFADTIIASTLPSGAVSSLFYADRIYQLPYGVIAIAAGTVLLPEMSRFIAAGEPDKAHAAQNRAMLLIWFMAAPFFAAFLTVPELIMQAFFARGAFTSASAEAAGAALLAYGVGLPAIVLIRSAVASFYARGDTATPLWASLTAIAVNVGFKIVLMGPLQQAGLALATSIGAWVNLGILMVLAVRSGRMVPDRRLLNALGGLTVATALMGAAMVLAEALADPYVAGVSRQLREPAKLVLVGLAGGAVYGLAALVLFKALGMRLRR